VRPSLVRPRGAAIALARSLLKGGAGGTRMKRIASAFALVLAACSGSSGTTTPTSTSTDSLVSNQVALSQSTHTTTVDCFSTFQSCINNATTAAEVSDCQEALKSCLPAPPDGAGGVPDLCNPPAGGPGGDGHACGGDGGMMPPPPPGNVDGGLPPPPPPGGGGPGGDGPGMGGGPRPPIPLGPDGHIALATCHAELDKCLAAGTDAKTCTDTAHTCVHDALVAAFKQLCDAVATQCSACPDSKPCVDLTAKCAAGLPLPEPNAQ
jgi:hypothetical protein